MQLQCPICDAEYEVDASAIPYDGRDVQCSNCGHSWFQNHPDTKIDYALESSLYDPPPPMPQAEVASAVPKRELDPQVLRILREEVELEAAKRAAESAALAPPLPQALPRSDVSAPSPSPTPRLEDSAGDVGQYRDSGLGADESVKAQTDAEMGFPPPQAARAPLPPASASLAEPMAARRVIGPDILDKGGPKGAADASGGDTLRAVKPEPATEAKFSLDEKRPVQRGSFARGAGFYAAVLIACAAASVYIFAPELANHEPRLVPYLERYVALINGWRDQLNVAVPALIEAGRALAAQVSAWLVQQGWL